MLPDGLRIVPFDDTRHDYLANSSKIPRPPQNSCGPSRFG
jgi:hypothetical protein